MNIRNLGWAVLTAATVCLWPAAGLAQDSGVEQRFSAIAMPNTDMATGPLRLQIDVDRWSTQEEEARLMTTLRQKGQQALLEVLRDAPSTGSIRTPTSLAYQLRFAREEPTEEGGRRIMLITDRPIGFEELWRQTRSVEYPFTVIQMELDRDGQGTGTMTYATRLAAYGKFLLLEDLATTPIRLTEVRVQR